MELARQLATTNDSFAGGGAASQCPTSYYAVSHFPTLPSGKIDVNFFKMKCCLFGSASAHGVGCLVTAPDLPLSHAGPSCGGEVFIQMRLGATSLIAARAACTAAGLSGEAVAPVPAPMPRVPPVLQARRAAQASCPDVARASLPGDKHAIQVSSASSVEVLMDLPQRLRQVWNEVLRTDFGLERGEAEAGDEYFLAQGGSSADALCLVHRLVCLLGVHHALPTPLAFRRKLLEYVLTRPQAQVIGFVQQEVIRCVQQESAAAGAKTGAQTEEQPRQKEEKHGLREEHSCHMLDNEEQPRWQLAFPSSSACPHEAASGKEGMEQRRRQGTDVCSSCGDECACDRVETNAREVSLGLLQWWRGGTALGQSALHRVEPEIAETWGDAEQTVLQLAANAVAVPPPPRAKVSPDSSPPSTPRPARQLQPEELHALHAATDAQCLEHSDTEEQGRIDWHVSTAWRSDLLRSPSWHLSHAGVGTGAILSVVGGSQSVRAASLGACLVHALRSTSILAA